MEALGKRQVNVNKTNNTPWFMLEVKELAKQKKKVCTQYILNKTPENWNNNRKERNEVTQG